VDALRRDHNLTVSTPESSEADLFWVRDYIDTKSGYRSLASYWLTDAKRFIPFGFVCQDLEQAARAACWFSSRGEVCVVKADTGESGIGTLVIRPAEGMRVKDVLGRLQADPFYADEQIVVERFIPSAKRISPSVEIKVPKLGDGEPYITYISNQLFLDFGDFCGVQVDRSVYEQPWCADLERCSLELAFNLQVMGYVGYFDLDCIVSDENEIYMLEINSRRTGGTHVHEFARHTFGDEYLDKVSLLSFEAASSGTITDVNELIEVLGDLLYPMPGDEPMGLVVTITTPLFRNRFGYILLAPTVEQVLALREQAEARIREYGGSN
jgi:hypothetical protein